MLVLIDIADSILDAKMVCVAGNEVLPSWNDLVNAWWDMQFLGAVLQPRWLNQSQSQQHIWNPKRHLDKIPNNVVCLWETTTVPQSSPFSLSPYQNWVTWRLKSKASPRGGVSLLSLQAWEEDYAWQVLSALLMTLANHSGSVCVEVRQEIQELSYLALLPGNSPKLNQRSLNANGKVGRLINIFCSNLGHKD